MAHIWSIVGGEDKGGILVRAGLELSSAKTPERLATGALVQELELVYVPAAGERLHFRRLRGQGPEEGWISVALNHKTLAERVELAGERLEELLRGTARPRTGEELLHSASEASRKTAPQASAHKVSERSAAKKASEEVSEEVRRSTASMSQADLDISSEGDGAKEAGGASASARGPPQVEAENSVRGKAGVGAEDVGEREGASSARCSPKEEAREAPQGGSEQPEAAETSEEDLLRRRREYELLKAAAQSHEPEPLQREATQLRATAPSHDEPKPLQAVAPSRAPETQGATAPALEVEPPQAVASTQAPEPQEAVASALEAEPLEAAAPAPAVGAEERAADDAEFERVRRILAEMEASSTLGARVRAITGCDLMVWLIVGGEDKGGVLVREGLELSSPKAPERLSTGSLVQEVELTNERLRFRKLCGKGPDEGWISVALDHKILAERALGGPEEPETFGPPQEEPVEVAEALARAEAWRRSKEEAEREAERRREEERELERKKNESHQDKKEAARKAKEDKKKKADMAWRVAEVRRIASEAKEKSCNDRVRPGRVPQRRSQGRRGGHGRGGRSHMLLYDGAFLDEEKAEDSEDIAARPRLEGDWECYCDMQKRGELAKVFMKIEGSEGSYYTQARPNRLNKLSKITIGADDKPAIVSFRWTTWNGLAGEGTWRLSRSGDRIDGGWFQDAVGGGPWLWTGSRVDQRPLVAPLPTRAPFWYTLKVHSRGLQFHSQMREAGFEIVPDPWDDDLSEYLMKARSLGKEAFPRRPFMQADISGNRQLALLIARGVAKSVLGYCLCTSINGQELHIEQLAITDGLPTRNVGGMLLDWAVARAAVLGCEVVKLKGSNCNVNFMEIEFFGPKVHAPLSLLGSDSTMPSNLVITGGLAELREGAQGNSPVVCHLPWGTPVEAFQGLPTRRGHQDLVKLRWPVVGWASSDFLRPQEADEIVEEKAQVGAQLLEAMATVRSTVTGPDPFSMCFISSQALCDELQERKVFPKGWCTVVFGSFDKFRDDSAWWRHTWLRLGDGTIADITADQFDEQLPRLWWPADHSRYRPDPIR